MIADIRPSHAAGTLAAPFSKSDAHRRLICAALAEGTSLVRGVAPSEDLLATIDCLRALGARISLAEGIATVAGFDPLAPGPAAELPCRECGSTLRFLVPLALLGGREIVFTGSASLFRRPMGVYESVCRERGFRYELGERSLRVRGRLAAGEYTVPGDVSSQFISGLLFALPLLEGESRVRVLPPVESLPYIRMTMDSLRRSGVEARFAGENTIAVPGGQRYRSGEYAVEGDWSNAAFLEALNLLGGDVRLTGLDENSLQGDRVFRRHFAALRAGTPVIDLSDCPDLGPICMALAAALHGAAFTGIRRLRLKESDRCAAMAAELAKLGVPCAVGEERMTVPGGLLAPPGEALSGWGDHRVVMSLAVLCTRTGGTIAGAQAVAKSFPDFFDRLREAGVSVQTR